MINQSNKPKRGVTSFIVKATNEEVKYYATDKDGNYLVDFPNGDFEAFKPSELKPVQKKGTPISNKPKKLTVAKQSDKDALNAFFDEQAKTMPFNCDECNKPLYAYTRFAKRCVTCHIFPKSDFKSIATNTLNIFYLGADLLGICNHHDAWDRLGIANRKTMNVYSLALERFEIMKSSMPISEIIEGYKYLGLELTTDILNELK